MEEGLSFTLSGIGVLAIVIIIFLSLNFIIPLIKIGRCYEREKIYERLRLLSDHLDISAADYLKWVRRC